MPRDATLATFATLLALAILASAATLIARRIRLGLVASTHNCRRGSLHAMAHHS